jgi:hypothetical protein
MRRSAHIAIARALRALENATMRHYDDDAEAILTAEYEAWLAANPSVPKISADEALLELCAPAPDERSPELRAQIEWLADFCDRWEGMVYARRTPLENATMLVEIETDSNDDYRGDLDKWLAANVEPWHAEMIREHLESSSSYEENDETHGTYIRIEKVELGNYC